MKDYFQILEDNPHCTCVVSEYVKGANGISTSTTALCSHCQANFSIMTLPIPVPKFIQRMNGRKNKELCKEKPLGVDAKLSERQKGSEKCGHFEITHERIENTDVEGADSIKIITFLKSTGDWIKEKE